MSNAPDSKYLVLLIRPSNQDVIASFVLRAGSAVIKEKTGVEKD